MNAQEIIHELLKNQGLNAAAAIDALQDGELLGYWGWSQSDVEDAHAELVEMEKKGNHHDNNI